MKKSILFFILSTILFSKGTTSGTEIKNVAELKYSLNSIEYSSKSNELVNVVDQVIELNIDCQLSKPSLVQAGEIKRALPFVIENTGNGDDRFNLSFESSTPSDVSNKLIFLDDGDGIFNSGDTPITYVDLAPDVKATIFFVSDIPSNPSWTVSQQGIKAISNTGGSGIRGTQYKLTNYYAINGYKGGVDSSLCSYELSDLNLHIEKVN